MSIRLQQFKTGYHARITEAANYVNAKNPAAAIRILEPILATHPEDEALLNNLAVAYTHLGEQKKAAGNFEENKRYARKAREVLLQVIALEPTNFPAYINLTNVELELDMPFEAIKHAETAVRYAPDVAKTRLVRARAYMYYRRWNEAYADLKKAVQIQGEDALHHLLLGEVCQEIGKHVEAIREFEIALRLDNNMQGVWLEIGFSAAILGDFEKAEEAYRKAQRINGPNQPRVQALGRMINGG